MKNNKCFISYAHADVDLIKSKIIPLLKKLNVEIWQDEEELKLGEKIFTYLYRGIKESDFVIAYFNNRSNYVNFEIGSAIGQGKPVVAIVNDSNYFPDDIRNFNYVLYNEKRNKDFLLKLKQAILVARENVIDTTEFAMADKKKLIGIEVGTVSKDFEEELRITADLINLIKELGNTNDVELIQSSKGCLKSLFSIDLKSWAELIEKVIFMKPELNKKKAEVKKIEAEAKRIKAEEKKLKAEAQKLQQDTLKVYDERQMLRVQAKDLAIQSKLNHAERLLDILERGEKLGLKIQFDSELILLKETNKLEIKKPEKNK